MSFRRTVFAKSLLAFSLLPDQTEQMAKKIPLRRRQTTNPPAKDHLHLIMFQGGEDMIDRELVSDVQRLLDAKITRSKEDTTIDIWIDSGGGDAHSAFKLYRELRSRCSVLRAVVPDYAKSAATLLAIGCDLVFASPSADFGPLDVQIPHPDREGKVVSSLAGANAAEHLANLGVNLMLATGSTVIDFTGLPRSDVIKHLLQYSSEILKPVLSKLDPQLIHEAAEQLKVTRQYAETLLTSTNTPMPLFMAKRVSTKLVTQYPTHGFVIDLHELKSLGIPCAPLSDHPDSARIMQLQRKFSQTRSTILDLIRF